MFNDGISGKVAGGCQCGVVRFRATTTIDDAHLCHCRMWQKAVGNIFATLVSAPKENFVWTRNAPKFWRSSEHVWRGFCGNCGTSLCYDDKQFDRIGLMIATFDNPGDFVPRTQDGIEGRMPWFKIDSIAESGITEKPAQAAWAQQIKNSNRQHPDQDSDDFA